MSGRSVRSSPSSAAATSNTSRSGPARAAGRGPCAARGRRRSARSRGRRGRGRRSARTPQAAWVEKLACSSRPSEIEAWPVETGEVRIRARARASWATYSRIITPELSGRPGGEERRQPGERRVDQRGEPGGGQRDHRVGRLAQRVEGRREPGGDEAAVVQRGAVLDDERVLRGVVDLDHHRLLGGDQRVDERRVHLRHGPQRERVLQPRRPPVAPGRAAPSAGPRPAAGRRPVGRRAPAGRTPGARPAARTADSAVTFSAATETVASRRCTSAAVARVSALLDMNGSASPSSTAADRHRAAGPPRPLTHQGQPQLGQRDEVAGADRAGAVQVGHGARGDRRAQRRREPGADARTGRR